MTHRAKVVPRLVVLAWLVLPLTTWGLINPDFTPIHLVNQSASILVAKLKSKDIANKVELEVSTALKGKAPAILVIDLSEATKERADTARQQLIASADRPVLFFADDSAQSGYLHVHGMWLKLNRKEGGKESDWRLDAIDQKLLSTWDGGTDMLTRCVEYILAEQGEASVPAAAAVSWRAVKKIGSVGGQARDIGAVDLAGDGICCLFVAGDKGDRLLRPGKEGAFEDLTAKVKLASMSRLAAWGDFDGDGKMALASYDGHALTIWKQAGDGTFSPTKPGGTFGVPKDCVGMATIAVGTVKTPGLLFSTVSGPLVLLKPAGANSFESVNLPVPAFEGHGKGQACLLADFNGDSFIDIIQPYEKGGMIYLGNKDGSFDAPKPCAVGAGAGGGKAVLGDFDGDGLLDVLVAGAAGVKLFQNRGNGAFEETLSTSGEVAYKNQPHASWCGVCDFNNDSRKDIFIAYDDQAMMMYFNRGFRSFGQIPRREMALDEIPDFGNGQQMALMADLDGSGVQNLFVVTHNGDIWCALNNAGADVAGLSIRARLPANPPTTGPVNVTAWKEQRCMGTIVVQASAAPAFFGIDNAGRYTLKWRFPGSREMRKGVTVTDKATSVVLQDGK